MSKFLKLLSKLQVILGSISIIRGHEETAVFAVAAAIYFLLLSKEYV